jgi:hypothetical protein
MAGGGRPFANSVAILRLNNLSNGANGDKYPLARLTGKAVTTENRRGGAAMKFPPEPDGERASRAA